MWIKGRQDSGYLKFKLFIIEWLKIDCYILKFPKGSFIKTHNDPAPEGYEHHRFNFIFWKAKRGGTFFSRPLHCKNMYPNHNRIIKFRPDIEDHSVSAIEQGTRYVLSVGWLKKC